MIKEQDQDMYEAMRQYGGSFIQVLATLLQRADHVNYEKLERAFPEYFAEYRKMSEKSKQ